MKRPQIHDAGARLAICLIDLRAHFEAQLRAVTRAELSLRKCRAADDPAALDAAAETLRAEVRAVLDNRRNAADLIEQVVDEARGLTSSDDRQ